MSQGFIKSKPEYQAGVSSEVLRTNFNALCSNHAGNSEPLDVQQGMFWLDTNISNNWLLKARVTDGITESWITLMENVNGVLFPPSTPGGGHQYEHPQATALNPWSVTHNLGKKYVTVIVVDGSDNAMDPSSYAVHYVNTNQLTITFVTGATSGKAYVS